MEVSLATLITHLSEDVPSVSLFFFRARRALSNFSPFGPEWGPSDASGPFGPKKHPKLEHCASIPTTVQSVGATAHTDGILSHCLHNFSAFYLHAGACDNLAPHEWRLPGGDRVAPPAQGGKGPPQPFQIVMRITCDAQCDSR
jgi:hypothetical protein